MLSLLPSFFAFHASFFLIVVFSLVGKVFKKAFKILGFDKRKGTCRWVVEQDFHGNFQVNVIIMSFFPFSLCP